MCSKLSSPHDFGEESCVEGLDLERFEVLNAAKNNSDGFRCPEETKPNVQSGRAEIDISILFSVVSATLMCWPIYTRSSPVTYLLFGTYSGALLCYKVFPSVCGPSVGGGSHNYQI